MERGWQDWVQWIGSVILIPFLGVVSYKVFNNSERIAVQEAKQSADHEIMLEVRQDVKDMYRHVLSLERADSDDR